MYFNSHNDQLFLFLIYFSTLAIHVKSDDYGTLNFDRENLALLDMKKIKENGKPMIGYELAIACPAQSPQEIEFNSSYSHGKNSLFVKGTYGKTASPSSVPEDICTDVYKLSIVYNTMHDEFGFGYEVYYNSKEYKNFKDSNYSNFDSIANACSKRRSFMRNFGTSKPKLELEQGNDPPIKLGFLWILTARLRFDNSRKSPIEVVYTLSKGVTELGVECKDYNLGNEVYKQKQNDYVDSLYQNQANVFNNVEIPETDARCETKNECLTKYSLVPAEEFRFRSPEPKSVSCSNLTTVPIWRSKTQEVLQKLDRFLYALVNFAYRTITVISGVRGQLAMKRKGHQGASKIRLGDGNEMPVPNIIYKAVIYEFSAEVLTDTLGNSEITDVLKAVIIVVHNDPQFDPKDAICPPDNCEKLGWGEIFSSNNVYCCPRNKEVAKKLGMSYDYRSYKELDLTTFPGYDEQSMTTTYQSILPNVKDEMKKLFGEELTSEGVAQDEDV